MPWRPADTNAARTFPPFLTRLDLACTPDAASAFYSDTGGNAPYTRARRLCQRCPVRVECREWAIATDQRHGVWGGLSPEERAAELRERRRQAVQDHLLSRPE